MSGLEQQMPKPFYADSYEKERSEYCIKILTFVTFFYVIIYILFILLRTFILLLFVDQLCVEKKTPSVSARSTYVRNYISQLHDQEITPNVSACNIPTRSISQSYDRLSTISPNNNLSMFFTYLRLLNT